MDDALVLKVAGQEFRGWEEIEIQQGLDALAGHFRISLTDRWAGQPDKWQIDAGSPCEIWLGADKLMTAYIDDGDYQIDAERRTIEITGREKTLDLVDCSAVNKPGTWKGRKLEQIAADLTKPFGIKATAVAATGEAFPNFTLQQGETVFEAIQRMTKQRGVLPVTTVDGDLEFRTPGDQRGGYGLTLGENLLSFGFKNDVAERFSEYLIKGYSDKATRGTKGHPASSSKDPGVPRYRPLVIVHDDKSTTAILKKRALWEASVRAAKCVSIKAKVQGWRADDGTPYRHDRLVRVKAESQGVDADLLIVGVAFMLGARGTTAELSLAPPEAYSLEPLPPPKGKSKGKGVKPVNWS